MIDFNQIADAVVLLLKSGSFCIQDAQIARVLIPVLTAAEQEAGILKISVVPKEVDTTIFTRSQDSDEYKIDIGIQKKVANIETEAAQLLLFVKEILNFVRRKNLPTKPVAQYIGMENKPIYDVKQLSGQNVFTTVITVTYKLLV